MNFKFKVTPTCGAYSAPALTEISDKEENAIKQAKQRSGLARFDNWEFVCINLGATK